MHHILSRLLLFSEMNDTEILKRMAALTHDWETHTSDSDTLIAGFNREVKHILDLSTACGFDTNLWQCYLTYFLMTNQNSFTRTCERTGSQEGSVNHFAKADFELFRKLFIYDFSVIESDLGIDCLSTICNYSAIPKKSIMYNSDISAQVCSLREKLSSAKNADDFFDIMTDYYRRYGFGAFAMSRAFRIHGHDNEVDFIPISNIDRTTLNDLLGYERQKTELRTNTEAFLTGKHANNVLLYGDAGTGKSTCVKSLINEYYDQGLRMIEIYKHQFQYLSSILASVKNRNYRFIIFIDDLSFEENEVEYKFLKAVIEGGVETRPENVLIYATSNRRHLIREVWNDRTDMEHDGDIHRSDTIEEKTSLASRFGVSINFNAPTKKEYHEIVRMLAARQGIKTDDEKLLAMADTWEVRHQGFSGRTAQQFVDYMEGLE